MSKIKNVLVVNGSPKGKNSITLQTSRYLELLFPDLTFDTLHVGAQIKALEKDMTPAIEKLKGADLIVFSYPVYTFIAPYQLHRFIELLKEYNVDLSDKYATQISTSKHFYDWTAHRYIEDNALDLNLKYIKGLSADMDDLTTKKGQKEAVDFWNYVLYAVENDILVRNTLDYSTPNKVSVIPNTVTGIGAKAFEECKSLVTIRLGEKSNVSSGNCLFTSTNNLKYVYISDSLA